MAILSKIKNFFQSSSKQESNKTAEPIINQPLEIFMIITKSQLQRILPTNKEIDEWHQLINDLCPKYGINTPKRLAAFLSQCGHESADFRVLSENLNYSAESLMKVFAKYFRDVPASSYHRKPEKIANRVYSNRMGNGSEQSGDGWRYRGRGAIQVTGKSNYKECSQYLFNDERLVDNPDYLTTKEGALLSALWYWNSRNLNREADAGDVSSATRKINGGFHGLEDRLRRYNMALSILSEGK